VILDALINNTDRFPVIWRHKGNIGNILFTSNPTFPVVGIDQTVTANKLEDSVGYMSRFRLLLEQILQFGTETNTPTPIVDLCREYIKVKRLYDVGKFGLREMWIGLMMGICQISTHITLNKITLLHQNYTTTVQKLLSKMENKEFSGWGLERIRLEFLSTTLGLANEYSERIANRLKTLSEDKGYLLGENLWKEFVSEESHVTTLIDEDEWLKKRTNCLSGPET